MSEPINKVAIIVATDLMGGIGRNGTIPWKIPMDTKWFAYATSYPFIEGKLNAVVMGRKTWDSIPDSFKPLKNRLNFVISKSTDTTSYPESVTLCKSYESAMEILLARDDVGKIFIMGGSHVYEQAIKDSRVVEILSTRVEGNHKCDKKFPSFGFIFKHHSNLFVDNLVVHMFTRPGHKPDKIDIANMFPKKI